MQIKSKSNYFLQNFFLLRISCNNIIENATHSQYIKAILSAKERNDLTSKSEKYQSDSFVRNNLNVRFIVVISIIFAAFYPSDLRDITITALEDAYLGVTVFVALTLLIFYGAESFYNIDLRRFIGSSRKFQIPICSLLGALPGCGGAVVVITAYNSGGITLGAVVATLTSTMGDAAFLLIATRPDTALFLLPSCWIIGSLFGYLVDFFYTDKGYDVNKSPIKIERIHKFSVRHKFFLILLLPGILLGILRLSFVEMPEGLENFSSLIAICGAFLGLLIWVFSPIKYIAHEKDSSTIRAIEETCFISIWVILAFLAFEYAVYWTSIDLKALFSSAYWLLPLFAVGIGLIPGCGPQILVTTLYINGLIPFAALIGNAISNDGDALFPALAISPRVAIMATLLSTIPALIVSYLVYFLAPSFLS